MNKYQITLTPVDKFFFGGDMTFQVGKDEKDPFNEQYASYIIESSKFPQQTSLLGMLRFLILRNAGENVFANGKILDNKATTVRELIGEKSFRVNTEANHKTNEFGKILSITHVRLLMTVDGQSKELEFAPLFKELSFKNASWGIFGTEEVSIPDITTDDYKAKDGLKQWLTDGKNNFDPEKIFVEDRRIGINRDIKTGKTIDEGKLGTDQTDDKALFKQISYRFSNKEQKVDKNQNKVIEDEAKKKDAKYCFIFDAEIENDVPMENYNGQIVSVGGDNSQFIIGISKKEESDNILEQRNNSIYLLSPTFLTKEEVLKAKFAITNVIPFRFLKSNINAKSYHILSKEKDPKDRVTRSDKFELYAPGSIFYFEDTTVKEAFAKIIESKKEFRQIGYNAYQA